MSRQGIEEDSGCGYEGLSETNAELEIAVRIDPDVSRGAIARHQL